MNRPRCSLLSTFILVLLTSPLAFAQESIAKPVLSAPPPPAAPPKVPAPVTPSTRPNVPVDPTYVIGPEDSINVNVWKEPNFTNTYFVRPDGVITLPLVGDVMAAGRTTMQLKADITEVLAKELTDPTVTVSIVSINSKRVYFYGEVGRAGPLTLTPAMTLLQAIDTVGGLSPYAKKKKIYILRGEEGKRQRIFFDYTKAIKTGNSITLLPGDEIFVP
jgi:polysaccharide export outer membrane protein